MKKFPKPVVNIQVRLDYDSIDKLEKLLNDKEIKLTSISFDTEEDYFFSTDAQITDILAPCGELAQLWKYEGKKDE